MNHLRPLILSALALAAIVACSRHDMPTETILPDQCFIVLATITPLPPPLAVGDTVRLHATFNAGPPCIPANATQADLRWVTGDTAVVALDSLTGLVRARKPGGAIITVRLSGQTAGLAAIEIHVAAP